MLTKTPSLASSEVYEFLRKLASKTRPRKSLCLTVDCSVDYRIKSFTSCVVEHFGKISTLSSLEIPFDPELSLLHCFESAETNLVHSLNSLKLYIPEGDDVVMKSGSLLAIENRICAYKSLTALQLPVPLSNQHTLRHFQLVFPANEIFCIFSGWWS